MSTKYELIQHIIDCEACSYRDCIGREFTPSKPFGSIYAKYMFINTKASKESHLIDETMSLQHELLLDRILQEASISKNDCYITNMIKCAGFLGNGGSSVKVNANICINKHLNDEIALVKPDIIICMGIITASILFNDKNANLSSKYILANSNVFVIEAIDTLYRKGMSHMESAVQTLIKAKECLNL